jgi:hypothetical protein
MDPREEGTMLHWLQTKKKATDADEIITAVVSQTAALITDLHRQMDFRFKEVSAQIKEIELGLAQLETKLLTKDLKDKQAYGILHYKLHEAKHRSLDSEIKDLEEMLKNRKGQFKDQ